jgi:hypothetical protein
MSDKRQAEDKLDNRPVYCRLFSSLIISLQGPTNYENVDIDRLFTTKRYTMRAKFDISDKKPKVGPGDYELQTSLNNNKNNGLSFAQDIKMKMLDSFD